MWVRQHLRDRYWLGFRFGVDAWSFRGCPCVMMTWGRHVFTWERTRPFKWLRKGEKNESL